MAIIGRLPALTRAVLAPLAPGWHDGAPAPELPPEHRAARLRSALVELFRTLAEREPVLLALDDMHRAQPELWDLVGALVEASASLRLLVVLAYRRAELAARLAWTTVAAWERDGRATAIPLSPLDEEAVAALLPPEERAQAARWRALSGANPFWLAEGLRAATEGRSAASSVGARAASLAPTAQAALASAALLAAPLAPPLWAAASGLSAVCSPRRRPKAPPLPTRPSPRPWE